MRAKTILLSALLLCSCKDSRSYAQAICALVDVSGTYVDQKAEVVNIIKRGILPKLMPGDSLFVVRIDGASYQKQNLEADLTLDVRPSRANAQKLEFASRLDQFARKSFRAPHTDITGAMMLGAEYLKETEAGNRMLILFSDLQEDLPRGVTRKPAKDEYRDMRVVAMNVKKLKADNDNPQAYRARLSKWEKSVTASGAKEWRVILEPDKLEELVEAR